MKIKNIRFLTVFFVFTLCGCSFSRYTEPENRIYATALGIDKTTGGYLLTCETADYSSGALSTGEIFTAESNTLKTAFFELKTAMHKTPVFSKCPVVFIGGGIYEPLLHDTVLFLLEQSDFSFSVKLALSDNANRLLNAKTRYNLPKGVLAYEVIKKSKNNNDGLAIILNENKFSLPVLAESNGVLKITDTKEFYEK